jgi:RNA polymerase sigma-70 factor (ECF subfamily)
LASSGSSESAVSLVELPFSALYEQYFPFVWRCVAAEGIPAANLEDLVQEVFIIVHRRRNHFEGRANPKTWWYAICHTVAANHRRRTRRKGGGEPISPTLVSPGPTPVENAQRAQAAEFVSTFMAQLSDAKRPVFVMCLLEGMSAPDAAHALGVNLNTLYSRLRTVREDFQRAVAGRETTP